MRSGGRRKLYLRNLSVRAIPPQALEVVENVWTVQVVSGGNDNVISERKGQWVSREVSGSKMTFEEAFDTVKNDLPQHPRRNNLQVGKLGKFC